MRDVLQGDANRALDWAIQNPDQLTPGVTLTQPREGMNQLTIDILGDNHEDEGGFLIIHRDEIAAAAGQLEATAEVPLSITRAFPGEQPNSWRKISTLFPSDGRPTIETSYEQEHSIRGMTVYKPIEPYTGRPANAEDLSSEQAIMKASAESVGLPPELFTK
jgi:hypothetical protein